MEKVRMTVHEALCEIKVADNKIEKAIDNATFCVANKASNTKINGADIKDFNENAKASFQKVTDLIRRTEAIKAALSLSNAATKITVGDKEMSVAEGIYAMQHGMESKRELLYAMNNQYAQALQTVQSNNKIVEGERLDKFIASTFGNKEKASPEDIRVATETFLKQQRYEIVDPLDIKKRIDELQDEIDEFTSKIDSAIQISNATTYIEFNY